MKVILIEDVADIGQKGEVKEVAPGFARNHLIPKGLAVEATRGRLKDLEMKKKKWERKSIQEEEAAREIQERLSSKSFVVKAKAGEGGRLFGSVTAADIAAVISAEGIEVDKKKVETAEPIKTLGRHEAQVKLHPGVSALIEIVVEDEEKGDSQ